MEGGDRGTWGLEESLPARGAGLHSLQEIVSCEMGEDSHPRGVRRLYYDGELLLSCGLETHGCTVPQASAQTLALEMEKTWDMDELSRHYWAHVRGELCAKLQGYLKSWTSFTERTGTRPGPGAFLSPRPREPPRPGPARGELPELWAASVFLWRFVP